MRKLFAAVVLLAVAAGLCSAQTATPPTTALTISVMYDDGTPFVGKVTLTEIKPTSQPGVAFTFDATGTAKTTKALDANAVYYVRLVTQNATSGAFTDLFYEFPFSTIFLTPANLASAQATLVFRKADSTLASANVGVGLKF